MNTCFKKSMIPLAIAITAAGAQAAPTNEELLELIKKQQAEIEGLKKEVEQTDKKVEATADAIESNNSGVTNWASKTTLGGYGEHHYNNFKNGDDKVDAHRYVLFISHEYSDSVRMFSELELEHSLAGEGKPGEVELEQAFIEWKYSDSHAFVSGLYLVPVGILNETHEPETFYGVERNLVEKNIIPTTWWETGVMFTGEFAPGLSYNFAMHSGLKSASEDDEGILSTKSVRSGRQKSANAKANDFAYTARLKYTGVKGLEVAATLQYQEDMSQGLFDDASGTLFETHAIYNVGPFSLRALWAGWDISGEEFEAKGKDKQEGWYLEPSIKATDKLGFFVRYSSWDNAAGLDNADANEVIDYGVNYWLTNRVVFKADYQDTSDYNDNDSVNLGVGWSF